MSEDIKLFKPPQSYPEPPKDMWYEVPKERPQTMAKPKPIFPWEENRAPATRVFAEDKLSPEPKPEIEPFQFQNQPNEQFSNEQESDSGGNLTSNIEPSQSSQLSQSSQASQTVQLPQLTQSSQTPQPSSPQPQVNHPKPKLIFPWEENQAPATRVFAEDLSPSIQSIDTYSKNLSTEPDTTPDTPSIHISTPQIHQPFTSYARSNAWDEIPEIQKFMEKYNMQRKPHAHSASSPSASLKLTDFPTEVERPSLPVTPAPIRRSAFWGEDDLPTAEGVPPQPQWNPIEKLEELQRRQSETFWQGPSSSKDIPDRTLPSETIPESSVSSPPTNPD
jgi:glycogenin